MDRLKAHTKTAILGVMMAACYASAADATIIYNSPGTTTVATPIFDNIIVENASTTVNVTTGGVIRGVNDPSLGIFNAAARTRAGTLDVTGTGRVIADSGQQAINMTGNPSIVRLRDRALVIGDIVNEFTPPGWRSESTSLVRLYLQDQALVIGDVRYAGHMRMQDNALIVGNIVNPTNGSMSLDMRGGLVLGEVRMGSLNDYVFNMSGGSIFGGFRGDAGYLDLTMTGGTIYNGFHTGDFVTGDIHGGRIFGGIDITSGWSGGASELTIDGGQFEADPGEYLFSMSHERFSGSLLSASVDILGGQFGYVEQGLGFFLDHWVDFSIHGWDLAWTGSVLSGYLLDGSWFSNPFTFGSNWSGSFNIYNSISPMAMAGPATLTASLETHNVPEPGTLGLLAACAAGMLMFGRRRLAGQGENDAWHSMRA